MVLMPCRAADTGTGTKLSAVLTAVSLSTPVIRKSTVGRMVMLAVKADGVKRGHHFIVCTTVLIIFIPNLTLMHITSLAYTNLNYAGHTGYNNDE